MYVGGGGVDAEEERVDWFALIVLWLSVLCVSYSWCPALVCSL